MGERSAQHLFGLQTPRMCLVSQMLFAGALAESKHTLQTWALISAIDDYWSIRDGNVASGLGNMDDVEVHEEWLQVTMCFKYHCHFLSAFLLSLYTRTHTPISTLHYTCCYDEICGNQDLTTYSYAGSLILSHCLPTQLGLF